MIPVRRRRNYRLQYVRNPPAVQQPVLAELAVAKPTFVASTVQSEPERFRATAVIRVGKLEMELSNAVSPKLMQQLKELVSNA